MMYLVLTALLAMNISKDVLNAFVQINKGLAKTSEVLQTKSQATLAGLRNAKEADKAAPFLAKAEEVSKLGDEMIDYIENLKARVMACSMSGNPEPDDATIAIYQTEAGGRKIAIPLQAKDEDGKPIINKLDENQNNTTLLVGPNPQTPHDKAWSATELKKKLLEYKDKLKAIEVTNIDGKLITIDSDILASLDSTFIFNEEPDADGKMEVWETNKFYHTPLAAVVATMSKIETDVLNAKTSVMGFLASSINATDLKFSDVTVAAVPLQSYVLKGKEYELEVYLAAYNKTSNTKLYMGSAYNGDKVPENPSTFAPNGEGIAADPDGKCRFKVNTGSLGLGPHGYTGQIGYEKDGKMEYIPFATQPFFVGEPALVVSPVNMMVFYRGLDNPVEISVPGVDRSALSVSMSGGSISPNSDGTYNVKPGEGKEATINVSANINGESVSMPGRNLRIKKIPDPLPSFGGKKPYDSAITQGDASVAAGIRAEMEGFDFPVTATVTSFMVTLVSNGVLKEYPCRSNRISDEASQAIRKMKKGEKIFLEQIMCHMPDNTDRKLAAITLKIQ
ncbi:MAG: GldM family protein, partial [Flavobacteriales bacterium]